MLTFQPYKAYGRKIGKSSVVFSQVGCSFPEATHFSCYSDSKLSSETEMADLQLEIEGEGAVPATEELLQIEGLSGTYETEAEAAKEGILATIATIVGITGGTIAIAEKLYTWYQNSRKKQPKPSVDKVLLIGRNGQKLVLENASVEQIKKILDS